jgi:hypothetical protein
VQPKRAGPDIEASLVGKEFFGLIERSLEGKGPSAGKMREVVVRKQGVQVVLGGDVSHEKEPQEKNDLGGA